jgi:hypothetical protein
LRPPEPGRPAGGGDGGAERPQQELAPTRFHAINMSRGGGLSTGRGRRLRPAIPGASAGVGTAGQTSQI